MKPEGMLHLAFRMFNAAAMPLPPAQADGADPSGRRHANAPPAVQKAGLFGFAR
jgi:hypothetical protein